MTAVIQLLPLSGPGLQEAVVRQPQRKILPGMPGKKEAMEATGSKLILRVNHCITREEAEVVQHRERLRLGLEGLGAAETARMIQPHPRPVLTERAVVAAAVTTIRSEHAAAAE